jgi:hypothetical protein
MNSYKNMNIATRNEAEVEIKLKRKYKNNTVHHGDTYLK